MSPKIIMRIFPEVDNFRTSIDLPPPPEFRFATPDFYSIAAHYRPAGQYIGGRDLKERSNRFEV